MNSLTRTVSVAALAGLVVSGCSADSEEVASSPSASPAAVAPDPLIVSAAFYPLEYLATHVGGENVVVRQVTAPGIDPHDAELSPAAVRELRESDVIIYVPDFQPAVDAAIAQIDDITIINVADHIEFREATEHGDEDDAHADDKAHEDEDGHEDEDDHADEEVHEDEEDGHEEHGDEDPHFWLDPSVYAQLAPVIAGVFADLDADNADAYGDRAAALEDNLAALDSEFESSLANCERDLIVVAHEAFGYLTDAYGLEQLGLAGLTPGAEPSPARVREVREITESEGVTTIFYETLVDSSASETFASDMGLVTSVLDPLEGLVNDDDDYRSVMERNLDALVAGLGCS